MDKKYADVIKRANKIADKREQLEETSLAIAHCEKSLGEVSYLFENATKVFVASTDKAGRHAPIEIPIPRTKWDELQHCIVAIKQEQKSLLEKESYAIARTLGKLLDNVDEFETVTGEVV